MLSVIIPAYNEEDMISDAYNAITGALSRYNIENEIIFIDDGSTDSTWRCIEELSKTCGNVCGIHFSRNFGKDAAIYAGLAKADGSCCVVMDCDLQHPPGKIPEMYTLWQQGYEIIEGIKKLRGKESRLHSFCARSFYRIISSAMHEDMTNASDFKLLDKKVVEVLINMPERNPFFRALSSWVGFKKATVEFEVQIRQKGKSKWQARQLIKYAFDNISSFSSTPMQLVTLSGFFTVTVAAGLGIYTLFHPVSGQIFSLILIFSGGIILISLGIIGYYLWRMFDEIKGRPRYIISGICEKRKNDKET